MEKSREVIAETDYFTLWSDGSVGCMDGSGYCGEIDKEEMICFIKCAYEFYLKNGDLDDRPD